MNERPLENVIGPIYLGEGERVYVVRASGEDPLPIELGDTVTTIPVKHPDLGSIALLFEEQLRHPVTGDQVWTPCAPPDDTEPDRLVRLLFAHVEFTVEPPPPSADEDS